jgi:hypothetical protein
MARFPAASLRIMKCHLNPITMTKYPNKAPPSSLTPAKPTVVDLPNFQLSTGYPQICVRLIHNSSIWFQFAFHLQIICKSFGYFDLT